MYREWLTLLALSLPLSGFVATLNGTVVDPQQRVVAAATVVLTCGDKSERLETDSRGRFRFESGSNIRDCELSVSSPGFEPFRQLVGDASRPILIQLKLATLRESVNVPAKNDRSSLTSRASLTSATLTDVDLKGIAANTRDAILHAKMVTGTTLSKDVLYVDGLPTSVVPPLESIARITVNADPFSAEFSENDRNRIEITLKRPERRVRFNFGGASLGFGGENVLASELDSHSRAANFSLSGPIPRSPLTFSVYANLSHERRQQPVLAVTPFNPRNEDRRTSTSSLNNRMFSFSGHYWKSDRLRANLFFFQSRSNSSNGNVHGITLPEAGSSATARINEFRTTIEKNGTNYVYRGGVALSSSATSITANQQGLGVVVLGAFIGGGSPVTASRIVNTSWIVKNAVNSASEGKLWDAGVVISSYSDTEREIPNPAGLIQFETLQDYSAALGGNGTGIWFVSLGNGQVHHKITNGAAFLQSELLHVPRLIIRGGLRADYQSGNNLTFSPRLSAATELHGFILRGGAGLFVQSLPNVIFTQTMRNDGSHLKQFVIPGISLTNFPEITDSSKGMIRSRIDSNLQQPRNLLFKASVERQLGNFTAGFEYTWTRGMFLLGSRRLVTETGWLDLIESNRASQKDQLHTRLQFERKGLNIIGHYEFVRAFDNTDGPFSFPARSDDLRAEWARATGVSRHNVNLVVSSKLLRDVLLSAVANIRSSAPYNITSNVDVVAHGLYNDRAGRSRNSGSGPLYSSTGLLVYRKILLPNFLVGSKTKLVADVGLQVDNLLGRKNYLNPGSIIGSPLFGTPLSGFPGRSISLWLNFDQ
jgi:hypothetical protein